MAAFLVHRVRFKPVPAAVTVFGTVFMTSFAFSIWETKQISAYAYFDTRTRLWEFAIGTLLAVMTLNMEAAPCENPRGDGMGGRPGTSHLRRCFTG